MRSPDCPSSIARPWSPWISWVFHRRNLGPQALQGTAGALADDRLRAAHLRRDLLVGALIEHPRGERLAQWHGQAVDEHENFLVEARKLLHTVEIGVGQLHGLEAQPAAGGVLHALSSAAFQQLVARDPRARRTRLTLIGMVLL